MDSPTEPAPMARWYACVRCGHQVQEGSTEAKALRWTASPTVLFGQCQHCVVRKREAKREGGPLPKDTPSAFRLVLP